jgi:hypothetical protein
MKLVMLMRMNLSLMICIHLCHQCLQLPGVSLVEEGSADMIPGVD